MSNKFVSVLMVSSLALFAACGEKEQEITVQSIALSQPSAELVIGETLNLKATVSPSNATYDGITWTSTKTSVATVSGSGQVSALAEGNTTITAMAGGKTASCSITVIKGYVAVSSIRMNKESVELVEGNTESLTATVSPEDATDKTVSWSSSNPGIATVSSSGLVTAKAAGNATITVKTNDGGKTATCSVVVSAATVSVTGVSLNKTSMSMTVGDSQTLTATITPTNATNKSVTWSSSNTSVATVSSSGAVTAKAAGNATITVKTNDGGKTATCAVTVSAAIVSVTGVSLNKTSLSMTVGETQTLTATVTPSNATDKSVTWISSRTSIATVSSTGVVTAKAAGYATITVITNSGGKSATCSVSVQDPVSVTGVRLNKTSLSMVVGDTQTLIATVTPSNATDKSVTWISSKTSVATVSSTGVVTAKAMGTATITVKTNDGGMTATCSVIVGELPVPQAVDLGLSVKWASFNLGASQPEEFGYYYAWGEIEPKNNYSWETYKWCLGSIDSITKYCIDGDSSGRSDAWGKPIYDKKSVLEPEDDAAHVKLGDKWRMPTLAELRELADNCYWTWTAENGIYGMKMTSKKNRNSIFIPAADIWGATNPGERSSRGFFWSSDLYTLSSNYAEYIKFKQDNSGGQKMVFITYGPRSYGLSIRPVYAE